MNAQIQHDNTDPYANLISTFFVNEFPEIDPDNKAATLEYITQALISTNQVRYGPVPAPEALVGIRATIRNYVENNLPIPILVPYGSRKAVLGASLDIAELSSLKTLACLNKRIKQRYAPGTDINIRIEDVSGGILFKEFGEQSQEESLQYCTSFVDLISLLGYRNFINPILEKDLFTETDFKYRSLIVAPALYSYLRDSSSINDKALLESLGWKGGVPEEQKNYYLGRYATMFPEMTEDERLQKLAEYLAGSWARKELNGSGANPNWHNDFIRLTFAAPVPGSPTSYSKDVFYRTLPAKFATTHIAPWRAKGFMMIKNDNTIIPKIASWKDQKNYVPCQITIADDSHKVVVQSDYVLEE